MKKILIYEPHVSGHHVEYLYHLVKRIALDPSDYHLSLLVKRSCRKFLLELPNASILDCRDIKFLYLEDYQELSNRVDEKTLRSATDQLRVVAQIIREHHIDHCLFMLLDNAMQVALAGRHGRGLKTRVSGILFNPWAGFGTGLKRYRYVLQRFIQRLLLLSNTKVESIFVISASDSVKNLRLLHLTRKFIHVPDPLMDLRSLARREELDSEWNRTGRVKFLLFGSLNKRKGIFTILKALNRLSVNELGKLSVHFAGQVSSEDTCEFSKEFHRLSNRDPDSVSWVSRRLTYEEIAKALAATDWVLMPYDESQASSGVLAHAANFRKPVIGNSHSRIGDLISQYRLGLTVDLADAEGLTECLRNLINQTSHDWIVSAAEDFLLGRSAETFANKIIDAVK